MPKLEKRSIDVQTDVVPNVAEAYKQIDQATDIQLKQSLMEKQVTELQDLLVEGPPSNATVDAATSLVEASNKLEKAADPASTVADREIAVEDVTTLLTDTSTKLDTELQEQNANRSTEETQALENTENAIKEQQEQAESVKENQKRQEEKEENDGKREVREEDFEDPKVEKPAEFKPREIRGI